MEDDRHDIPGRGELWRGDVAAECPQEVPLVLRYAVVDLDVVVRAAGVVLQLKVVEGEEDGGALCHHDQPGTVDVVGVQAGEVGTGDVARRCREDSSAFETSQLQQFTLFSWKKKKPKTSDTVLQVCVEQHRSNYSLFI